MNDDYKLHNEDSEMPEEQFKEIIARLKNLPKTKAPDNFQQRLSARIEQSESGEDNLIPLHEQPESAPSFGQRIGRLRPAYGIAAAILIGFIVYQLYPVSQKIDIQNSAPEIAQAVPQQSVPKEDMAPTSVQPSEIRPAPHTHVSIVPESRHSDKAVVQETKHPADDNNSAAPASTATSIGQPQVIEAGTPTLQDLRRPNSQSAGITPVSSGTQVRQSDSLNPVDASPFGALLALKHGIDSLHVRDSIKKAHQLKLKKK